MWPRLAAHLYSVCSVASTSVCYFHARDRFVVVCVQLSCHQPHCSVTRCFLQWQRMPPISQLVLVRVCERLSLSAHTPSCSTTGTCSCALLAAGSTLYTSFSTGQPQLHLQAAVAETVARLCCCLCGLCACLGPCHACVCMCTLFTEVMSANPTQCV